MESWSRWLALAALWMVAESAPAAASLRSLGHASHRLAQPGARVALGERRVAVRAEGNSDFSDRFKARVQKMKETQDTLKQDLEDESKTGMPSADEIGVPAAQQPMVELQNAKKFGFFFNWPSLPLGSYLSKIGTVYLIMGTLAFPFAQSGFDARDLRAELITANMVACGFIEVILLRLFISWDYIGQRLLSDRVEYEQTGWYDGDVWEKPPQVQAKDRLLHSNEVQPALTRIQQSLAAFALVLLVSANSFNSVAHIEDPRRTIRPSFLEQLKAPDEETRQRAMEQAMKAAGDKPAWILSGSFLPSEGRWPRM